MINRIKSNSLFSKIDNEIDIVPPTYSQDFQNDARFTSFNSDENISRLEQHSKPLSYNVDIPNYSLDNSGIKLDDNSLVG